MYRKGGNPFHKSGKFIFLSKFKAPQTNDGE